MRVCLDCATRFEKGWTCPECGYVPKNIGGFPAFDPLLSGVNHGFKDSFFDELAPLEAKNFWFRSRNRLITWALDRYCPGAKEFLEIGCGTGYVLSGIAAVRPEIALSASEISSAGLAYAARRTPQASFFQMDARKIPFDQEFGVVGAFDVLEHIEEDELVLGQIAQALKPGGGLLLTVPQHRFLWSEVDRHACHVRRYQAEELRSKVCRAGLRVIMMTSFVSLLLPLMFLSRLSRRGSGQTDGYDAMAELRLSRVANFTLEKILDLERYLIKLGLRLPVGGSLLLVAQKV